MAKILLVEDDKSLREIYGVRLMAEGYEIVSAGDGEEALAMAIKERPDLIVSDVMMPKISGFDMLDILRSTSETKDVKVIMMTALSSDDQRARGESLGADRYLVKSQVGIEDVVRTVHDVLSDGIGAAAPAAPIAPAAVPVDAAAPAADPLASAAPANPFVAEPAPAPVAPAFAPAPAVDPMAMQTPAPVASAPVTPDPYAAPVADPAMTAAPAAAPVAVDPAYAVAPEPAPAFAPAPEAVQTPAVDPMAMQAPAPVTPDPYAAPVAVEPVPAPAAPAFTPAPEAAPAPVEPAMPAAPASTTLTELPANPAPLPQPTAPFSSPAPASLGERVIEPLTLASDPNVPSNDIASQMEQALSGGPVPPTQGTPPVPPAA